MSDAVLLAIIAVVASLLTGTVVVAVGVWADGRRKRAEAATASEAVTQAARVAGAVVEQQELSKVRQEYRDQIHQLRAEMQALRDRLDAKDVEIDKLQDENRTLRADVRDLTGRLAQYERKHP